MKKEKTKSPRTDLEESIKGLDEIGASEFWKAKEGKNTIRIVPWKKVFFFKGILHYGFKRVGGRGDMAYPCLFNDPEAKSCPICDFHEVLANSPNEKKVKLAQRIRPTTKYYVNLLDRNRVEDGIKMLGFSGKQMRTLRGYLSDEDYGDITDPEEGRDIILTKEGTSFTNTSYDLRVRAKSSPLDYDGWEEEIHDLAKEVIKEKEINKDFLKKRVDELKKILSGEESEEDEPEEKPKKKHGKKRDEEDEEEDEEESEEDEEKDEEDEEEDEKPKKKKKHRRD